MPYKSDAQRRFFHSAGAKKAGISAETIARWDKESKGKALPERAGNTQYPVVPAVPPHGSLDPIQDTIDGISGDVPTSHLGPAIAGTSDSQVETTPITAYRGSVKGY